MSTNGQPVPLQQNGSFGRNMRRAEGRGAFYLPRLLALLLAIGCLSVPALAQAVTSPKAQFGANIGDDYFLANYSQMVDYWKKLDTESDFLSLVDIGKTSEG